MNLVRIIRAESHLERAINALKRVGLDPKSEAELNDALQLIGEVRHFAVSTSQDGTAHAHVPRLVQFITRDLQELAAPKS